jgi:uncharacterized protein YqfA (UPF0365 family)
MEVLLLAIQARILLVVGFAYLAVGMWMGVSPATAAWRAAVAAFIAMTVGGWLLRRIAAVVEERAVAELAEAQLAIEQAQQQSPTHQLQQRMANAHAKGQG